jgi:hypothetical protein
MPENVLHMSGFIVLNFNNETAMKFVILSNLLKSCLLKFQFRFCPLQRNLKRILRTQHE